MIIKAFRGFFYYLFRDHTKMIDRALMSLKATDAVKQTPTKK